MSTQVEKDKSAIAAFRTAVHNEWLKRTNLWEAIVDKMPVQITRASHEQWAIAGTELRNTASPVLELFGRLRIDASPIFRLLRAMSPDPAHNPPPIEIPALLDNLALQLRTSSAKQIVKETVRDNETVREIGRFITNNPGCLQKDILPKRNRSHFSSDIWPILKAQYYRRDGHHYYPPESVG